MFDRLKQLLGHRSPAIRRSKAKIGIYGSCQAVAVRKILETFPDLAAAFEFVSLAEHLAGEEDMKAFLANEVPTFDLLIFQPISSRHKGPLFSTVHVTSQLPPTATTLSFQYLHFEPYAPFADGRNGDMPMELSYPDFLVGGLVIRGYRGDRLLAAYREFRLSESQAEVLHQTAFRNFEWRYVNEDGGLDIKCTEFIREVGS